TKKHEYKDYKTVALKTLSNSQNLKEDFLQELTLYKMFRSSVSNMVPCYGISRDTEGNYIMVMEYMKEGNLRDYLRKNYKELVFYNDKRIHQDFHSGNIIVDVVEGDEITHDTKLALKIIRDGEPNNRPTAREVSGIVGEWFEEKRGFIGECSGLKTDTQFYHQYEEAEKHNKTLPEEIKYPTYQSQE
ncbi:10627_t:CDS:2, partial [Cetraspora pellucida]